MIYPPDYHMHTPLCRHAAGEPVDYAARALDLGLTEIGFSDHSPMARDDFDDWRMRIDQLDQYVEKVRLAQKTHPQLAIKLGLEIDYLPGHEPWIRRLATRHDWDYLIGSVHYISDHWALDNPGSLSEWKNRRPEEVWSLYFERLTQAAASGLFDIIGHADLCKKFRFYPEQDCTHLYQSFLQTAHQHDVAIEINTAGLRKECREIYPSRDFLLLAFKTGLRLTFGSDAHAPEEVGLNFPEAVELARESGYSHYCRFSKRRYELVPL